MPGFYIDYKNLKIENTLLPKLVANVNQTRRNIGVLRWRISDEILSKRNLKNRLEEVCRKLQHIEHKMNSIYNFTNSCIAQYKNAEQTNQSLADKFL
ncbi:MAG: hypothetical protein NC223_03915 [Butyrivibrio sp.]|nr:hypothetical protein [Butyrivibrio sp.]